MTLPLKLTYSQLAQNLYSLSETKHFPAAEYLLTNEALHRELSITNPQVFFADLLNYLKGQHDLLPHQPISQAYAGHQFGNFTILGDGRASLLGELVTASNKRYDIHLKGSGRTPYSRHGDGKASIGPMVREYIMSEALHALGIPSTRTLAIVRTNETVHRQSDEPGAILVRTASSHIRVGTFQFAAIQDDHHHSLTSLLQYTLTRHHPDLLHNKKPALALLRTVMKKQIDLIVNWLRVGFIHGVMNTDNMSIPGETIDYGPCAFMNRYHPLTAFSSVDFQGRYAFARQPLMAKWNLSRFAESLLPLIDTNQQHALELAQACIDEFDDVFASAWLTMMANKLGYGSIDEPDKNLIESLLAIMQNEQLDYTHTFLTLTYDLTVSDHLSNWQHHWLNYLSQQGISYEAAQHTMKQTNPSIIARNHLVEKVIDDAVNHGDITSACKLVERLQQPYKFYPDDLESQKIPENFDENYQTFCGT